MRYLGQEAVQFGRIQGHLQKCAYFALIGGGHILDTKVIGAGSVLRTAVIFFYLSNEGISLLENAAHLGMPVPKKLKEEVFLVSLVQNENIDNYTIKSDEVQRDFDYYMAQRVAEQLKNAGLISIDEFNKLTALNRRTFLPMNVEILPKIR